MKFSLFQVAPKKVIENFFIDREHINPSLSDTTNKDQFLKFDQPALLL